VRKYEVYLTNAARRDLDELYAFIARNDAPASANHVLEGIARQFERLAEYPERGEYPKELLETGIREYRQYHFKPYRIIYRVQGRRIYVYLIVDGRRDMQSVLAKRLLTG